MNNFTIFYLVSTVLALLIVWHGLWEEYQFDKAHPTFIDGKLTWKSVFASTLLCFIPFVSIIIVGFGIIYGTAYLTQKVKNDD